MDLGWNPAVSSYAPELLLQLRDLRTRIAAHQKRYLAASRPPLQLRGFLGSASNLAAYLALRRHDLADLERRLASFGLASLRGCEAHVIARLDALEIALLLMQGQPVESRAMARSARALERNGALLHRNANSLLGAPPAPRATRLMVSLPRATAADYGFVRALMERGMDCARLSCARDDKAVWRDMIANVRQAEKELGRACKVLMELGGRQPRTGPVAAGPPVLHVKLKRDAFGDPLHPTLIVLDGSGSAGHEATLDGAGQRVPPRLAVERKWLAKLEPGDRVAFRDVKGRKRELAIEARLTEAAVAAACADGAYIARGTELEHQPRGKKKGAKTKSGAFESPTVEIGVEPGDTLLLTREPAPGKAEQRDKRGRVVAPAHIGCIEPAVFDFLRSGHAAWIGGGRVGGLIEKVDKHGAWVRITHARPEGEVIGAGAAIHLPDTPLDLPVLSERDRVHLDLVCKHADIVGLPGVRDTGDLDQLIEALPEASGRRFGILAQIETRAAVDSLPDIIMHGAGRHPFGIVIGHRALAVELGYERLAPVHEEIRRLCAAAHVPVVWPAPALATCDVASRAEIVAAAAIGGADCVMLNEESCTLPTVALLDRIFSVSGEHREATAPFDAVPW